MTKHIWDWADDAPEIGVPIGVRITCIAEECKLCGALTLKSSSKKNGRRYLQVRQRLTKQPLCPSTCEMTAILTVLYS